MYKLKILKPKHFITFQNILFIKNCLEEERMKSFNKTFTQIETIQLHNTGSINTHQLKRCSFKREKYWANVYQTGTNPKCKHSSNIQKSKRVTITLNTQNNSKKNKQLQMNSNPCIFIYPCLFYPYLSISLFLSHFSSFYLLLPGLLSSLTQKYIWSLNFILRSPKFNC